MNKSCREEKSQKIRQQHSGNLSVTLIFHGGFWLPLSELHASSLLSRKNPCQLIFKMANQMHEQFGISALYILNRATATDWTKSVLLKWERAFVLCNSNFPHLWSMSLHCQCLVAIKAYFGDKVKWVMTPLGKKFNQSHQKRCVEVISETNLSPFFPLWLW